MISKFFPEYYIRKFYKKNRGKVWGDKKSCFTLSFDCDYTADIKAIIPIIDTLSSYSFKSSFACIGKFIEKYPKEHIKIIENGHEILNHTYTHPDNEEWNPDQKFNELTIKEQRDEIKKCDESCKKILNYKPIGFRVPHFGRLYSEGIYKILKELGYKYSSSTIALKTNRHGLPFLKDDIIEFPLSPCLRHPKCVFDTWHALGRGEGRHKEDEFYDMFKRLIEVGINTNSYINVYFDPQDIVKLNGFSRIFDYIEERVKDVWVVRYGDVVKRYGDWKK